MKSGLLVLIQLLIIHRLIRDCLGNFDSFYFSLQWPGSRPNTTEDCCYPLTGKPKTDFIISKFQPMSHYGENPTDCNPNSVFSLIEVFNLTDSLVDHWPSLDCPSNDGVTNWSANWAKFGTCSNFDQYAYFKTALDLKIKIKLLQNLEVAGIRPDDNLYEIDQITRVVSNKIGHAPIIYCNKNTDGDHQLYEIWFCVEKSGLRLTSCPWFKMKSGHGCKPMIKFPSF